MSWNGPESLGGRLSALQLSAVPWQANRLDIFGVDTNDHTLQHWWFDNGWGNNAQPESLGGRLIGAGLGGLSAVSWHPGRLDIFGIGANDQTLQHWWFDNGWGNNAQPESLGGRLSGSGLSAVSWQFGRLDIFGIGANRTLQHWWWDNSWGGPESLGGPFANLAEPSAVSWQPGRLDIFAHDNGLLQHWWWDNSWGGPESLGGGGFFGPSAVSWQPGRLDIFGVNAGVNVGDHTLQHLYFDNGWGNNAQPESLGGRLSGSGLSAVSWKPGRLDIFGIGADQTLQHWWFDNGWGNNARPESLGGRLSGALSAVSWQPGRLDIFGVSADDHTLQHWWYF